MRCPHCKNALRQIRYKSLVLELCFKCRGIWFDEGKFLPVVHYIRDTDETSPEGRKLFKKRSVQRLDKVDEAGRLCPKCGRLMRKFNYASDSNVILDRCDGCGGIWADAGEVQRIARYLKADPEADAVGRGLAELSAMSQDGLGVNWPAYLLFVPRAIVPLADDTPRQRLPIVTVLLIAVCTVTFAYELSLGEDLGAFFNRFGFFTDNFFSLGLVTSMFLHKGVLYLTGNMLFLWLFGDNVEDRFGHVKFLIFYLCGHIAGSFLHSIFSAGLSVPTIGASGAISAVLGAYLVFYPAANIRAFFLYRIVELPVYLFFGAWFAFQLLDAVLAKTGAATEVAWFAHVGGFIFGAVVAFFCRIRKPSARDFEQADE